MDKEQAIAKVGLFEALNPKYIKGIAGICTERSFKPGEYLMKQGESGIGLFIILSILACHAWLSPRNFLAGLGVFGGGGLCVGGLIIRFRWR